MARKYSRDNRGRFASGGGGATARGGRLATASGGKRKTQTMKAKAAGGAGVIRGRAARTVAGESAMKRLAAQGAMRRAAAPKSEPPKATAAQRKKALIRDASSKILAGKGKEVGAARRGYIRAQQEESLRMEKTGKGSKAARRMASASGSAAPKLNAKDAVGRFGKRLKNGPGNVSHSNNASVDSKRKVSARGLRGSRPKNTMAGSKTNPSLKRRIAYK